MLSRVPEGEGFARPRPPRKSGRFVSLVKDRDDPPPYDSPSHPSSESPDATTSTRAKHDGGTPHDTDIRPRGKIVILI